MLRDEGRPWAARRRSCEIEGSIATSSAEGEYGLHSGTIQGLNPHVKAIRRSHTEGSSSREESLWAAHQTTLRKVP